MKHPTTSRWNVAKPRRLSGRLRDVLLERRDDVSRGPNNDVLSVRLHDLSNKSQMKHPTTSQLSGTSQRRLSSTYPRCPIITSLPRLL